MAGQDQNLTKKERKALKKQQKLIDQERQTTTDKQMRLFRYLAGVLVVIAVGYWLYSRQVPVPVDEQNKPIDQVHQSDWVRGPASASAILIEYSDFQCPACRSYEPVLTELLEQFGENLAIVYRHFPLKQIHLQAELAAQASEAAGKQGKFWEMSALLFERQQDWAENRRAGTLFSEYAQELGLDVPQFEGDLKSKEVKGLVKADFQDGLALGINSTPTFYLNGEQINNPRSVEEFAALIQAQIPATDSGTLEQSTGGE